MVELLGGLLRRGRNLHRDWRRGGTSERECQKRIRLRILRRTGFFYLAIAVINDKVLLW